MRVASTVCDSTAFSLNFTLALSAAELWRTAQAYWVMLRADIWLIATFSTSTAGLLGFGFGEGDGVAAGAAGAPPEPPGVGRAGVLLPGTAAGTAGQLCGSIGTTAVALTAAAAARAVSFKPCGLMVAIRIA